MAGEWRIASSQAKEIATGSPDTVIARLAATQYGVVSRAQMRAAGLADASIGGRAADGRLIRLHRGVYAVAHTALTPNARRLAAVLACGDGAALSHRAAAELWGVLEDHGRCFDVTVPGARGRGLPAIRAHRASLDAGDVTVHDGIPVTTLARTYLDLAASVRRAQLDRALERGEELRLFDLRAVENVLDRNAGRAGAPALAAAVAALEPEAEFTRSQLERFALRLVRRHGLPRPAVNAWVHGGERDLAWPQRRVIVEIDTYTHHGSQLAFHRDRARDAELTAAGYRVIRFTGRQLEGEADRCAALLATVLGGEARAAASA